MSVISNIEEKRDIKQIEFKLSEQYYNENKSDDHESDMKYNKLLNKYFNNQNINNEWWEYINDILNLIVSDYSISIAL